jgi:hypothetical protein
MGNWVELIDLVWDKAKLHSDAMILLLAEGCLTSISNLRNDRKTPSVEGSIKSKLLEVCGRVFPLDIPKFLGKVRCHPVH